MDTLESLRSKLESAADINAVVKTMKAVAAANIGQYERSVAALGDYYRTIALGLAICLKTNKLAILPKGMPQKKAKNERIIAIAFGSDQGLVGRFNDTMTQFVGQSLEALPGVKDIWAVGERIQLLLNDEGFNTSKSFSVPGEINAITSLIDDLLIKAQQSVEKDGIDTLLYLFYNQPKEGAGYTPVMRRLLPLDEDWQREFTDIKWPTNKLPQVAGNPRKTLSALISEYLFVSLYKAAAESLASENSSRLNAMQRAEKNIDELLEDLNSTFNRLRQSSIDEELFDVVAGFEALKKEDKYKV